MKFNILSYALPLVLSQAVLLSCTGSSADSTASDFSECADTLTHHARYLTIADMGNGTVMAEIGAPWCTPDKPLARYALVHRDSVLPEGLPDDVHVLRVPLSRMAVYSSVHASGLEELGALPAIAAVADGRFFAADDSISRRIAQGTIADVGKAENPSVEKIAAARVQAVLRSPMEGIAAGPLPSSVVPVEMTDYLETSPIARAEWLLLLGELTGRRDEARAIFSDVIDSYSELAFKAAGASSPRPKVLTESEQGGVWYLPAGKSYMARMIADAGGDWPWADTEGTGSLALSLEAVAEKAIDADVWLLRTFGYTADAASLRAANPRYARFRPVREGTVYGCDTSVKPVFNDIAFHPEKILADYVAIFHPEAMPGYNLRYFSKSSQ